MPDTFTKDRLSLLFSVISDPFCILDNNDTIIAINDAFLSFFHISRDLVLHQHMEVLFTRSGLYEQINPALHQIREQTSQLVEIDYSVRSGQLIEWYRFCIRPIIEDESPASPIQGIFITIQDDTSRRRILAEQSRNQVLMQIFHETIAVNQNYGYSRRLIQYLLSRLGPVLQVQYISFLEINKKGERIVANELSLWSLRYGFLVGEDLDEDSSSDYNDFQYLLVRNSSTYTHSFNRNDAPKILQRIMNHRDISDILVLPVIQKGVAGGCLILWNATPNWSPSDIVTLLMITDLIGDTRTRAEIEGELARIKEKFSGVVEYIGDMYYLTDKAGNLLEVSPSMVKALDYHSSSELIGLNMEGLLKYPDGWPLFLSDVLNKNGVKDYELILQGNNGKVITGSVSCRLVYDEEGYLRGIEGVIRDISRRRQYEQLMQESEWKLEQAQKIAKVGVWSYDNESRVFKVTAEIFSLLAIPDDKSFITLDDLIAKSSTGDKPKFSQYFDQMVKGGNEFGFEFKIDLPDEKYKHIRIKGQPRIRGGIVTGSFGILQDVTERKEVEQHLLNYANQLEQKTLELDAMRTQLLDMNRELDQRVRRRTTQIEELLRQKDEFIMQIGHDLKTPLTPLVALLPIIRKKITDPEIGELMDISIEDVQAIKKLIATILDLAQMNALYTVSDLQNINLHEALDQIISDNAYLIHQKSLTMINDIPHDLSIQISPMHFETLMTNLIGNAVKYSYINGDIKISAYEKIESVIVAIEDHGVGIEPDVLPRIFDTFYRADSSRHDRESHGLGLAIAQRVADIYGGIIRAESKGAGKGSTFSVQLKKVPHSHIRS